MGAPNPRPLPDLTDEYQASALARLRTAYVVDENGCWVWQRALSDKGYGRFHIAPDGWPAHRASYFLHRGKFDHTLDLDHLCRNRACVNPDHLEPVVPRVNVLRGETLPAAQLERTHCPNGHPYSGDNLILRPSGRRGCRACIAQWKKESVARQVAEGRTPTPRVTHCKRGHEYTPENTRVSSIGARQCIACLRITRKARRAAIKAEKAA